MLGSAVYSVVQDHLLSVILPMVALVLLSLFLAFRRWTEVLLSLAVLLLSGLLLLMGMRLAGWSWNLLNLMALPLLLGTGVDYSIFVQLALKRYDGNLLLMRRSVGRALLLCGATAIAGFGSLAFSSNAGMQSLGLLCAIGLTCNLLIALFLLPAWWRLFACPKEGSNLPSDPSLLYGLIAWRTAIWLVRRLPAAWSTGLALASTSVYRTLARHRRAVVEANLAPVLTGNITAVRQKSRELFRQFALKLVDLWRFEAGLPIDDLFGESRGWEYYHEASKAGRGVLLVTPHLGNWEFGGFWLSQRGVRLQVITLAEPGRGFTDLRKASRTRWNIETVVIRDDPFAFLEIIRKLESGATVALLIDRPPQPTGIGVQLFGKPFQASIAAAELARASGCAVLPVIVPREGKVYTATILPPVPYERSQLRDRAARQRFSQELMRAFEPAIRQYPEQWFHFVPVWQADAERSNLNVEK